MLKTYLVFSNFNYRNAPPKTTCGSRGNYTHRRTRPNSPGVFRKYRAPFKSVVRHVLRRSRPTFVARFPCLTTLNFRKKCSWRFCFTYIRTKTISTHVNVLRSSQKKSAIGEQCTCFTSTIFAVRRTNVSKSTIRLQRVLPEFWFEKAVFFTEHCS